MYVCAKIDGLCNVCLLLLPILLQSLTTYWRIPTASLVGSWWLKLELVSGLVAAGVWHDWSIIIIGNNFQSTTFASVCTTGSSTLLPILCTHFAVTIWLDFTSGTQVRQCCGWLPRKPEQNTANKLSRDKMTNHISFNKRWITTVSNILRFTF